MSLPGATVTFDFNGLEHHVFVSLEGAVDDLNYRLRVVFRLSGTRVEGEDGGGRR
jgi:hypothetical protein